MSEAADLVLTGGKVVTVDPGLPEAEAVAVRGDRILAVGTAEEIERYVGEDTEVIDLEGKLLIPGFIESHGHFVRLGDSKMILDLTTAQTWEEIVAMVGEAARKAPGKVDERAAAQRRGGTAACVAVGGVTEQPGAAHAREQPRRVRERESARGRGHRP
jgi:hypothetical protein